jgi:4-diphosphocytidyl-2-C-methyl-D-erythritol kinase
VSSVTVRTPAKINLSLVAGPTRADGFHYLATVYQAVGLYDHVTASPADDGEVTIAVSADRADGLVRVSDVPADERNLAVRAARLLAERTGTEAGVRLHLRKGVPVAGGLAGGSSDAAAALVACNQLWRTGLSEPDLVRLAARLGSDVPFCLLGGTAVGRGRGELVSQVPARGPFHWVLALNAAGLPTPAVYGELDRLRAEEGYDEAAGLAGMDIPAALLDALRDGDVRALGPAMANDLQPAALSLRPELAGVLRLAATVDAEGALVSGSGPTCAFLARDEAHAQQVLTGLNRAGCSAVCTVGPVPGARVVPS